MATEQGTIDQLLRHLRRLEGVTTRKMFGEYALYVGAKLPALVCDNQLFIKPTDIAADFLDSSQMAPPYPGAKPYYCVPEDMWHNEIWLTEFLQTTTEVLPLPKPKKRKS